MRPPSTPTAAATLALILAGCSPTDDTEVPGDPPPSGFWFPSPTASVSPPTASDLGAIGYASRFDTDGTTWTGVRVHDADAANHGPFVFSSGHESAAFVLKPDGSIERRWALDAHPENGARSPDFVHETQRAWRRVVPLTGGGLLAIHEGLCMLRLDAQSRVLWKGVDGAHHDLLLSDTGTGSWGLALDRRPARPSDLNAPKTPDTDWIVDDGLAWFDVATGDVAARVSLIELLQSSRWSSLVSQSLDQASPMALGDGRTALDPLHANALLPLASRNGEGALVLLRDVGALVHVALALDTPGKARVIDVDLGAWQGAHDPQWAPQQGDPSSLVLFDNHGDRSRASSARPASRLQRLTGGRTQTIFQGSDAFPFHSAVCGSIDALPGGGWLVTETTGGRAFQIDATGAVTWEFRSPFRDPGGAWVSALLDMRRMR